MVGMHAGFALIGLLWLGVPLFLIGLVVWAVTRPRPAPAQGPVSAMDILQRRFASGEISAEEYQKARDLLQNP